MLINNPKTSLFLLASAGLLAACVKSQWMVTYQDQDPYISFGNATTVDAQGNAFLGGYLQPRDAGQQGRVSFVAKYDGNGTLMWDHRFQDLPETPYSGVSRLLTDKGNNLYVTEVRLTDTTGVMMVLVSKLNARGSLLWQQQVHTPPVFPIQVQTEMGSDGNLHILASGLSLLTFAPSGALLWSYEAATRPPTDHGNLPPFEDRFSAAAVDVKFASRNLGAQLQLASATGDVLATFGAEQLELEGIIRAYTQNGVTIVLGDTDAGLVARRIVATENGFSLDTETTLTLPDSMVSFNNATGGFCYAAINTGMLTTGYVNADLTQQWQHSAPVGAETHWTELVDVVATPERCHTQYMSYAPHDARTMVAVEEAASGNTYPTIELQHFGGGDLAAKSNVIMQAGITGPYTTEEGTAATLIKHTVR